MAEQAPANASRQFWTTLLEDTERCLVPATQSAKTLDDSSIDTEVHIDAAQLQDFCAKQGVSAADVVRVAWALVIRCFTGMDVVVFGNSQTASDDSKSGLVVSRIDLSAEQSLLQILADVQKTYTESVPHQAFPLSEIQKALKLGDTPLFNTVLSFHTQSQGSGSPVPNTDIVVDIAIETNDKVTKLTLQPRPGFLSAADSEAISSSLALAISHISQNGDSQPSDISLISKTGLDRIWEWNRTLPEAVEECMHEHVRRQCNATPDAIALSSWDGELTYQQLNRFTTALAKELRQAGITTGDLIPICFEKSLWAIVAMLAVLQAGAAFVPLDMAQGIDRRQIILNKLCRKIALTSKKHANETLTTEYNRVVVGQDELEKIISANSAQELDSNLSPSQPAYAFFTSGSTGEPKGVVVEHTAMNTSCIAHGELLGFSEETRSLQFAAFTFDPSIAEIFATLIFGGCVCIPSDDERFNDLSKMMDEKRVNLAIQTPSVARLIDPARVPTLKTLSLGGEACSELDIQRWSHLPTFINEYGPTEATVGCVFDDYKSSERLTGQIGKGLTVSTWIVSPTNHNVLAPVGSIGELVLEGPVLARGYLGDEVKTADAFIESPQWLAQGSSSVAGRSGRVYKTGDLVRYNTLTGDVVYLGRKDTQVKLRGQRIELGEIEYQVLQSLDEASKAVAELIQPTESGDGKKGSAMIAVFLVNKKTSQGNETSSVQVYTPSEAAQQKLAASLPSYMLPSVFFLVDEFPMGSTGKTNRAALRKLGSSFSPQQLAQQTKEDAPVVAPTTEAEKLLHGIWAEILNIDPSTFGRDHSFLRLGGDSMTAMRVSTLAREASLPISVSDILRKKTLKAITEGVSISAKTNGVEEQDSCPDFASSDFAKTFESSEKLQEWLDKQPGAPKIQDLEDIYACNAVQELWLMIQMFKPGALNQWIELDISVSDGELDIKKLIAAWEAVVRRHPLLRNVFSRPVPGVAGREKALQMILLDPKPEFTIIDGRKESYPEKHEKKPGQPKYPDEGLQHHATFIIVDNTHALLRLEINHTICDGYSLDILYQDIKKAYDGELAPNGPSFKPLIDYRNAEYYEKSHAYWFEQLAKAEMCHLKSAEPPTTDEKPPPSVLRKVVPVPDLDVPAIRDFCSKYEVTVPNVIRAAYLVVLRHYTGINAPCFMEATAGRDPPVKGIDQMFGPVLGALNVHVDLTGKESMLQVLADAQEFYFQSLPHQWFDIKELLKVVPPLYNTVITFFQRRRVPDDVEGLIVREREAFSSPDNDCTWNVIDDGIDLEVFCGLRQGFMGDAEGKKLAKRFSLAVSEIVKNPENSPEQLLEVLKLD